MPLYSVRIVLVLLIVFCGSTTASADTFETPEAPRLSLSLGHYGLNDELDEPYRFGLEYGARPLAWWKLVPSVGFVWAVNDSVYAYAGMQRHFALMGDLILTPSFEVGFFEESSELQLGHNVEFRSGLTVAYAFGKGYRLGMALYHLSNGGIGDQNPGTESLVLKISTAL